MSIWYQYKLIIFIIIYYLVIYCVYFHNNIITTHFDSVKYILKVKIMF